jgi:hypothetical protein
MFAKEGFGTMSSGWSCPDCGEGFVDGLHTCGGVTRRSYARWRGHVSSLRAAGADEYEEYRESDAGEDEEEEAEVSLASLRSNAHEALVRAIRRTLTQLAGGELVHDLTAAVIETARGLLGDRDECTVAQLNELFGLSWREPHCLFPLDDLPRAIVEIEQNLYFDWDMLEFLDSTVARDSSALGSSPKGSSTMLSDGGIGLYEFAVDDGVYFFVLAEHDVCDSQWWFAHAANDLESRIEAIRNAEANFITPRDLDE